MEPHEYIPTPAEILRECRRIQATWSPAEEQKRRVFHATDPSPPMVANRIIDLARQRRYATRGFAYRP
jgi:hypothetical protein